MHEPTFADDRLSAYLDGVLSPEERRRLEDEIRRDPRLRHELELLTHARRWARDELPTSAPPDLLDTVLRQTDVPPRRHTRALFPAGGLLLAALALLTVYVARPAASPDTPGSAIPSGLRGRGGPAAAGRRGDPTASPSRYVLRSDQPDVLERIATLAARHGGYLADPGDATLDAGTSRGTSRDVVVELPAEALHGFRRALRGLGDLRIEHSAPAAGEPTALRIRIERAPPSRDRAVSPEIPTP